MVWAKIWVNIFKVLRVEDLRVRVIISVMELCNGIFYDNRA